MIVRHPAVTDTRNARNRARWTMRYFGGQHFPDLRNEHQYRAGEWLALQAAWRRRALCERKRLRYDTEELA